MLCLNDLGQEEVPTIPHRSAPFQMAVYPMGGLPGANPTS